MFKFFLPFLVTYKLLFDLNPPATFLIPHEKITVTITCYTPSKDETDDTPNLTAIMEKPIPFRTCAVSRDLKYLLGKYIYIEGFGILRVNDLMNKRFRKSVDIVFDNKKRCFEFGKRKHEKILTFNPVLNLPLLKRSKNEKYRKDARKYMCIIPDKWLVSNGSP